MRPLPKNAARRGERYESDVTSFYLALVLGAAIDVVVDGTLVPSAPPARLAAGRVVVPVAVVTRLAESVTVLPAGDALNAVRAGHACAAPIVEGTVALAPLARCLGAHVAWDPAAHALAIAFPLAAPASHAPYDPNAPRAAPTTVFTPEPAPPPPRATAAGSPRPRRTAIPIGPPGAATDLRRRG